MQRVTTEESTSVADDGTITTERTTTTIGFSAPAATAPIVAAAPAQAGVPGAWKLQSSATKAICDINLYGAPGASNGEAASNCMQFESLRGLTGWRAANGTLELLRGQEAALVFRQLGPNRFDGQASWLGLTTTLALYR
jgi:hypothetical protein